MSTSSYLSASSAGEGKQPHSAYTRPGTFLLLPRSLDMHMYRHLLSNGHYEPYRTFPDGVYQP